MELKKREEELERLIKKHIMREKLIESFSIKNISLTLDVDEIRVKKYIENKALNSSLSPYFYGGRIEKDYGYYWTSEESLIENKCIYKDEVYDFLFETNDEIYVWDEEKKEEKSLPKYETKNDNDDFDFVDIETIEYSIVSKTME